MIIHSEKASIPCSRRDGCILRGPVQGIGCSAMIHILERLVLGLRRLKNSSISLCIKCSSIVLCILPHLLPPINTKCISIESNSTSNPLPMVLDAVEPERACPIDPNQTIPFASRKCNMQYSLSPILLRTIIDKLTHSGPVSLHSGSWNSTPCATKSGELMIHLLKTVYCVGNLLAPKTFTQRAKQDYIGWPSSPKANSFPSYDVV